MSGQTARKELANAGWFKAGVGGNPNGRPKGQQNKLNASIKDMILTALHDVGGAQYLAEQANKNPVAFMGLVAKVLPLQITGSEGGALVVDFRWADAPPTINGDAVDTAVTTVVVDTQSVSHETTDEPPAITFISDC